MKRIAVSTGGGDAPGLNAVVRAVVKTAINEFGAEVYGIRDGLDGFLLENGVFPLTTDSVRGILPRGGTILGTANRSSPFARRVIRDGQEVIEDVSEPLIASMKSWNFDALVLIGGDGTLHIAQMLCQRGVPVVGVPKTIDNDVGGTDYTFGFDTAVTTAMEAIDKLHTTAESHHRVMVLEVMGRDAGFIALHAGLAGGADVILIPEIPFTPAAVCGKVHERMQAQRFFSIVVAAEGAFEAGGKQVYTSASDGVSQARLGGIGERVMEYISQGCGVEVRLVVLGHLQRGGSPSAFDRVLATRLGSEAVRIAAAGKFNHMAALRSGEVIAVSLDEALRVPKRVDIHGDMVRAARAVGIALGDEK